MDILDSLNPAQKEAAETIQGPILILAGPGSGKTRVITHRVAYLIKVCGISPQHIIAVTFTNKAAREMKERLESLVGDEVADLTIGTFHAICSRILRRDGRVVGISPNFVIYDAEDQLGLLKRSIKEIGLDPKQYAPQAIASAISGAKSLMLTPGDYLQCGRSYFDEVAGRVYERYQQLLTESNALDFDDLLMRTVLMFRRIPEILSRYQSRYQHLLVDEFQDTNVVQYEFVKQIGGRNRNICVVGDPDQSIYSWRFADIGNILSFEKDYPDTKLVVLGESYRSTKKILEAASSVIVANRQRKPKELWTQNEAGEPPVVLETYDEREEAQYVVSEVERLVGGGEFNPGECAVMYRTNAQSRVLEEAFMRGGMPYKLVAGTRFYARREVKDVIAYLRLVRNPQDSVSLARVINVPGRGVGQQTQAKLVEIANDLRGSLYRAIQVVVSDRGEEDKLPSSFSSQTKRRLADFLTLVEGLTDKERDLVGLFNAVIERTDYHNYILGGADGEERWENVMELRNVAQEYSDLTTEEGLTAFLEGVALVSDVDGLDESVSAVTLITLHQAKGLEFPVVFMVGMEDGILPHFRSFDDPARMEEERRLCYVGITRGKKKVYLIRAFRRNLMGRSTISQPSRFLSDVPTEPTSGSDWQQAEESWEGPLVSSRRRVPALTVSGLRAGDHVHHARFGEGVVVSFQTVPDDAEVVIAFNQGIKKLLLSFAKLEKLE